MQGVGKHAWEVILRAEIKHQLRLLLLLLLRCSLPKKAKLKRVSALVLGRPCPLFLSSQLPVQIRTHDGEGGAIRVRMLRRGPRSSKWGCDRDRSKVAIG